MKIKCWFGIGLMAGMIFIPALTNAEDSWMLWKKETPANATYDGTWRPLGAYKALAECRVEMLDNFIPTPFGKINYADNQCVLNECTSSWYRVLCNTGKDRHGWDGEIEYQCFRPMLILEGKGEK